jgi:hypothetical protein
MGESLPFFGDFIPISIAGDFFLGILGQMNSLVERAAAG